MVLCGGSTKIPRLQTLIRDLFPDVDLLSSAPPDELIAVGAALEAGLLVGQDVGTSEDESSSVDVCAADIVVKVPGFVNLLTLLDLLMLQLHVFAGGG